MKISCLILLECYFCFYIYIAIPFAVFIISMEYTCSNDMSNVGDVDDGLAIGIMSIK